MQENKPITLGWAEIKAKSKKHNREGKILVFCQNEEFCSMIKLTEMKEHEK